jgi:hypothetical protein
MQLLLPSFRNIFFLSLRNTWTSTHSSAVFILLSNLSRCCSWDILRLVWKPKVHYTVQKNPPCATTLSQFNPLHIITHFDIPHVSQVVSSFQVCISPHCQTVIKQNCLICGPTSNLWDLWQMILETFAWRTYTITLSSKAFTKWFNGPRIYMQKGEKYVNGVYTNMLFQERICLLLISHCQRTVAFCCSTLS